MKRYIVEVIKAYAVMADSEDEASEKLFDEAYKDDVTDILWQEVQEPYIDPDYSEERNDDEDEASF